MSLCVAGYKEEASAYRSTNEELEDLVRVTKETKLRLQVSHMPSNCIFKYGVIQYMRT